MDIVEICENGDLGEDSVVRVVWSAVVVLEAARATGRVCGRRRGQHGRGRVRGRVEQCGRDEGGLGGVG